MKVKLGIKECVSGIGVRRKSGSTCSALDMPQRKSARGKLGRIEVVRLSVREKPEAASYTAINWHSPAGHKGQPGRSGVREPSASSSVSDCPSTSQLVRRSTVAVPQSVGRALRASTGPPSPDADAEHHLVLVPPCRSGLECAALEGPPERA